MEIEKDFQQSICLNMIVKNESKIIENTLEKLCNLINFSYWVISDTGSSDNTPEIIINFFKFRGIPGELFRDQWTNFGSNRTLALNYAYNKSDYLFIFDADDEICGDFKIIKKLDKDYYIFNFGTSINYSRILLVNNRIKWKFTGVLHEFIELDDDKNTTSVGYIKEVLEKPSYYVKSGRSGERNNDLDKYLKDAKILKKAYKNEKKNIFLKNRYAFYCANSYRDAGYTKNAISWYIKFLKIADEKHNQEKYISCLFIAEIFWKNMDSNNAIKYLLNSVNYDPERIEGIVRVARIYRYNSEFKSVNILYDQFKNYKKHDNSGTKPCLSQNDYLNELEYENALCAFYTDNKISGYECCKKIIIDNISNISKVKDILSMMIYYENELNNDEDTKILFIKLTVFLYKNNIDLETDKLWKLLALKNKDKIKIIIN